jgi:phage I-like protein
MIRNATTVTLHVALPAFDGQPPAWVHLIPAGEFRGKDGRGPYRLDDPAALLAAVQPSLPLPIDEMHATDLGGATLGMSAPARGWIVEMESRADGIWGRVDWTPSGATLVAEKAYRGISPALQVRKQDGVVLGLLRASLTNTPNLTLTTLHNQQGMTMDLITRLRTLLGLEEAADEAAIITALEAVMGDRTLQTTTLGSIAKALGLADQAKPPVIVTALQTRLAGAGEAATLQATVTELQSQLATLQQTNARERAVAAIDAAIRAGKPIKPRRDQYIARHMQDAAGVEADLAAMPSINAGGLVLHNQTPPAADGLTAEDTAVIALMGVKREDYLKQREAEGQRMIAGT